MKKRPNVPHHPVNARSDVFVAGAVDPIASTLYDCWYSFRCRSHDELAMLHALMLRAHALGSLGSAWRELADSFGTPRERTWWALLIGSLVQCITNAAPATEDAEQAIVDRLWDAWDTAASNEPPVWATPQAVMPRLSRVRADLPLDARFSALSALAQLLLLALAGSSSNSTALASSHAWALAINAHQSAILGVVEELSNSGWIRVQSREGIDERPVILSALGVEPR